MLRKLKVDATIIVAAIYVIIYSVIQHVDINYILIMPSIQN